MASPHLGLVAVHLGGVDVPVAGLERRAHRGHRVYVDLFYLPRPGRVHT
jgi:hypothetical protein